MEKMERTTSNRDNHRSDDDVHTTIPLVRWLGIVGSVASRKEAASVINKEKVQVNGETITALSYPVRPNDQVCLDGKRVVTSSCAAVLEDHPSTACDTALPKHVHIMLHKPPATLSGRNAKRQIGNGRLEDDVRPSVFDIILSQIIDNDVERKNVSRAKPIGRLDVDTTGLLLFTSDGALANALASPQFKVPKVYRCVLRDTSRPLSEEAIQQLERGVVLPHAQKILVRGKCWNVPNGGDEMGTVDMEITSGYKHQVKLMLKLVGRPLKALHRLRFASLQLDPTLKQGSWRYLTPQEVERLHTVAGQWKSNSTH